MASVGSSANAEAAAKFWEYFQQQKESIKLLAAGGQDVSQSIRELDTKLREAFIYLPSYDQKQCTKDIDDLRSILHTRTAVANKGKGGFKFKSATTRHSAKTTSPASTTNKPTNIEQRMQSSAGIQAGFSFGYSSISDSWIVASADNLRDSGSQTDCELRDISNCIIDLRSISLSLRALNCHGVKNSIIVCGPIAGSATMRDSTNSTLVLGVRQFRLENSKEINVFVHCISRPIIEKSTAVVFAPFPLVLETAQVRKEFEDAKLAGMQNMYDRVDDFNWLRRQASPNWSINDTPPTEAAWALLDGDRTDTHREQALATLLSKQ